MHISASFHKLIDTLNFRSNLILLSISLLLISSGCSLANPSGSPVPVSTRGSSSGGSVTALKIYVEESGIYELNAADLKQAGMGDALAQPANLHLFYRGASQPVWIEGSGQDLRVRFYGLESQSIYSREDIYWLVDGDSFPWGNPQLVSTASEPAGQPPFPAAKPASGHYYASIRLEQNKLYVPQVESGDHWFWMSMPAPQSQSAELTLDHVAQGSAVLLVNLWASTEAQLSPDHHLKILIDDQVVADETWDGKGWHQIRSEFQAAILKDGVNTIKIEAPGDTGVAADITDLDWLEVYYPRQLMAQDDRLDFWASGGKVGLDGFSGPIALYDVTEPDKASQISGSEDPAQGIESQAGHHYLAVGPKGALQPVKIELGLFEPDLRASSAQADYIAIGPSDLLEPLQPLLDWRSQNGLKVAAVPLQAVYDQFNFGLPEPVAIQAFMQFASKTWQKPPQFLLLVGDASYDPRGYQAPAEANRLPTFLVETDFGGETASDVPFVQNSPLPGTASTDMPGSNSPQSALNLSDIAVGRIPARTPDQVSVFVQKTIAYEQDTPGSGWQPKLQAVADGQDPIFKADARAFLDLFPKGFASDLYAPPAGVQDASQQIIQYFDAGDLLVAYFGHGSVNMWGKDRLFNTDDIGKLATQQRLPVVINMTCLTGLFTHPKVESLAEALLWQKGGGAVAVLAPTSLTLPTDQSFLSKPIVEEMLSDPDATLGQVLQRARQQVPIENSGTRDVLETFLLFGDPALHLPHTSGG